MSQNRLKGICNKAGFMKGGDHHYSRACCSNCANASYLLSFTSTPPYSHVSHFLFFRLHNDQKSLLQKVLFRDCIGFHCYSLQMALRWAPEATLKRSFCLHTRAEQQSQTIPTAGDPLCWPCLPLGICCQILFHFHTDHLERGSRIHSAGRILCLPCGSVHSVCTAHTLMCYYTSKLLSVVLSPFVSL